MTPDEDFVHFIRSVEVERVPPAASVHYYEHDTLRPGTIHSPRSEDRPDLKVTKHEAPVHHIRLGDRRYRLAFHPNAAPLGEIVQALADRDLAMRQQVDTLRFDLRMWQRRLDNFNALPWHKRAWVVLRGLHV